MGNIRPAVTSFLPRHTQQTMGCTGSKDSAGEEDAKTLNLTTLRFANVVDYHETARPELTHSGLRQHGAFTLSALRQHGAVSAAHHQHGARADVHAVGKAPRKIPHGGSRQ